MTPRILFGDSNDPTRNLAVEEALLLNGAAGPFLYLWQNAHTVVIGSGQNAWKECRTELLTSQGGTLVRRTTGGGAVYHDLGNLNFSFVMPQDMYDVPTQAQVIADAIGRFGVVVERSGRNDLVIQKTQAKFSGNAFRMRQDAALHHGTILVNVDMDNLGRYLAPSRQKLQAKGVESVRSRVENLSVHAPHMTIPALKEALAQAFADTYGASERVPIADVLAPTRVDELTQKYRSWEWTYGKTPRFDVQMETRFAWGGVELMLSLRRGTVEHATCFTDSMDADLGQRVASLLVGSVYEPAALSQRLADSDIPEDRDIAAWLAAQEL
ncbi:MAG TPA: lipoate--protein ligase [Clostridiales bacterium]|nr:lipoate--protein ligase [Clostridiales bacterium]